MFVTLPHVFDAMPAGDIVATAFFLLVIFAALTSAISLMEALVYVLMNKANLGRYVSCGIVTVVIIGLGLLSCLGYGPLGTVEIIGMQFLNFFDFISNSVLMPIVAILTCIFIGFVIGTDFIIGEVESSGQFKAKRMFVVMIKWVCPFGLALILMTGLLSFFGVMSI